MTTTNTNEKVNSSPATHFFSALNLPVFLGAVLMIFSVMAVALLHPEPELFFNSVQGWISTNLSWYYMLVVALIFGVTLYIACSRFGNIKLGPDHSQPEYSDLSWFAMLFSTGMGVGLMFFGVAEPMIHYLNPPEGLPETTDAAREAINITFLHWGIHGWAIYALVGLLLAYFSFRHKLPLAMRSALYPILGERIYGRWGDAVDIFAIVGTAFGVATSLGLGVAQINNGLHFLFPDHISVSSTTQIVLIIITTMGATVSVSLGLDKGIKILSEINLIVAALFLAFIFFFGGKTIYLLQAFIQNIGDYINSFISKTFNLYAYEPQGVGATEQAAGASARGWLGGWTIPYWGWWLSWAPFVGMFIARISRGRTIRNFIFGVLVIPTGFTFFWMSVLGNSALSMVMNDGITSIADVVKYDNSLALFEFLRNFPVAPAVTQFVCFISVFIIAIFFITSADSGALVMDMLASKFEIKTTPLWQRIFWGSITGFIALILLHADGLRALQTATTASAFPFSIMLIFLVYGLFKALKEDYGKITTRDKAQLFVQPSANSGGWEKRLLNLVVYPRRSNVIRFIQASVIPAFEDVQRVLSKQGLVVKISQENDSDIRFEVDHGNNANFLYRVKARHYLIPDFSNDPETKISDSDETVINEEQKFFRAEVYLDDGSKGYDIMGYTKENISDDIVDQYTSHLYFIQNYQTRTDYEVGEAPEQTLG